MQRREELGKERLARVEQVDVQRVRSTSRGSSMDYGLVAIGGDGPTSIQERTEGSRECWHAHRPGERAPWLAGTQWVNDEVH